MCNLSQPGAFGAQPFSWPERGPSFAVPAEEPPDPAPAGNLPCLAGGAFSPRCAARRGTGTMTADVARIKGGREE
jgi:hypothetical protein